MASPGSAVDKELGIKLIGECINRAHEGTEEVTIVLENSAGGANFIGTKFQDLKGIIDHVKGKPPPSPSLCSTNLLYKIENSADFDSEIEDWSLY